LKERKIKMGNLGKVFDKVPEGVALVPEGWYTVAIKSAEVKPTKGGGSYLNVGYTILGPTHQGRVVFGMIQITNKNPAAEEIGDQQMAKLRLAVGIARLTDSDQLVGKNLSIKLSEKKDDDYGDKNEVKGWKSIEGSAPPALGTPKPATTGATASRPAWAKPETPEPEIF
jgi:hypothetical protein